MEPASPSAYVSASLCVSHEKINKTLKKKSVDQDCLVLDDSPSRTEPGSKRQAVVFELS